MNKENIAIITDSSCDLPKEYIEDKKIFILPLYINMPDGSHFLDGVNINPQEIYKIMPDVIPKTSQPTPNDVAKLFEKIKGEGYKEAIIISISSGMSGMYHTINMSIKEEKELIVHSFDSKKLSMAMGMLVIDAIEQKEQGKSAIEILNHLEKSKEKSDGFFCIPTLKYLVKGGRIGRVSGAIGTLIHVVPVISINKEGVYYSVIKTLNYSLAIKKMLAKVNDIIDERTVDIAILQGDAEDKANELFAIYKGKKGVRNIYMCSVSPVMGVHSGSGLVGIVYRIVD
jgi:DegV family protein with EDD domain